MTLPRAGAPAAGLRALLVAIAALGSTCRAGADGELRNWFDDPFFQISADVADCPVPAGPFVDESERRVQAHHRAERGTTCWLARECEQPNAYAYDRDIASAFRDAARERNPFAATTLWVTVQGRVVYIEGCATADAQIAPIEDYARAIPYVQQAIAIVRVGAAPPPYKLRERR